MRFQFDFFNFSSEKLKVILLISCNMATGLFYNNLPTILFTARNSDLILISVKNVSKRIFNKFGQ